VFLEKCDDSFDVVLLFQSVQIATVQVATDQNQQIVPFLIPFALSVDDFHLKGVCFEDYYFLLKTVFDGYYFDENVVENNRVVLPLRILIVY
jgi:hypothetical protein